MQECCEEKRVQMFVVSAGSFVDAQLVAWLRHLGAEVPSTDTGQHTSATDTIAAATYYDEVEWVAYADDYRRSGSLQTRGSAAVVDCEINAPRVAISPELREVETLLM